MIQKHLKDVLKTALPSLEWSIDTKSASDHTGTVYSEGGPPPGEYEVPNRSAAYMVYISSSDYSFAQFAGLKAIEILHKRQGETVEVDYFHNGRFIETKRFYIQFIRATGEVNVIGIENGVMDVSVNFIAELIEQKEEITNGT